MSTFDELAAARRQWIAEVLQPWCRQAVLRDLKKAALDWVDIAGKVDAELTLWYWAWSRFPDLVNADLSRIDETAALHVQLKDGREIRGYADGRLSTGGQLVLTSRDPGPPPRTEKHGPISIDDIAAVTATTPRSPFVPPRETTMP
jgi:hypothetical protein